MGEHPLEPVQLALEIARASAALFVIVDPVGLVPIIISLTSGMSEEQRSRILRTATYVGGAFLLIFALAGQQLLALFDISIHSFMIAGGVLLFILSIEILTRGERISAQGSGEEIGVVPLAFPLLVGPGAITSTIITIQSSGHLVALASIAVVMILTWATFRSIDKIYKILGRLGSTVVARVMAVFIASIAVDYVFRGIQHYYPPLQP